MAALTFGVLYDFRNPAQWGQPSTRLYAALLDQIASLEPLGFDAVWLTEHHLVKDGYLPAPFALAGAVAARTQRLRIGTNVLLLPLHHPVHVAENAAVLDVLSGGRFVLGVGLGYRADEFEAYGVSRAERGSRMEEGLQILRRCWSAEGPFDFDGRHYRLRGVDVQPRPLQARGAPIWVGAHSGAALERAARLGDGWLAAGAERADFEAYRDARARLGRPLGPIAALRNVWLGDWSEAEPYASYVRDLYRAWYGAIPDRSIDGTDESFGRAWYLLGDPSEVADQIEAYREEVPFDHLIMLVHLAGMDTEVSERVLRRFAEQVMPKFS